MHSQSTEDFTRFLVLIHVCKAHVLIAEDDDAKRRRITGVAENLWCSDWVGKRCWEIARICPFNFHVSVNVVFSNERRR